MRLLIVTGPYRSGTTLVQKALSTNRVVNIIDQGVVSYFKVVESLYFRNKAHQFCDRPLCLEYFEPDDAYRNIFLDIEFTDADVVYLLGRIREDIEYSMGWGGYLNRPTMEWLEYLKKTITPGRAKQVLEQMCEAIRLYRGGNRISHVGFKELNLEQFIESLAYSYGGNLKVILLVRDPRAILASRNFGTYTNTKGGGKNHPLLLVSRIWRNSIRYKWHLADRFRKNFLPVYYERLVRNPEKEIKRICKFAGIEFNIGMIDTSRYYDEEGKKWLQNTSYEQGNGFVASSIDRWRDILPKIELHALEYLCWHEMAAEGYAPVADEEKGLEALMQYEDDKDNLKPWTFKFNLILDPKQKQLEVERHNRLGKSMFSSKS